MSDKTFDEKMNELDERIDEDQRAIDQSLLKLALDYLARIRYTNNGTAP